MIIVDSSNNTIAPNFQSDDLDTFTIPGYLHNTPEVILDVPRMPYKEDKGEELQVWYVAEDYFNAYDHNNVGEVCINVYLITLI